MYHTLYLGLDAHTRTCTLAGMDPSGRVVSTDTFLTSESARIAHVIRIPAKAIGSTTNIVDRDPVHYRRIEWQRGNCKLVWHDGKIRTPWHPRALN